MRLYTELLKTREKENRPIKIAVLGSGWFGAGLVGELFRWPGMEPKLVVSLDINRSLNAFVRAGVARQDIVIVHSAKELSQYIENKTKYLISDNLEILRDIKGFDVAFEGTGDVKFGAQAALWAIEQGIHFITVNAEMDATVGYILSRMAQSKGLIYSNSDGDQPGVLMRMIEEVKMLGFEIVVAGNCKGFVDYHANPESVMPWVRPGHNPKRIASFADGTKQGLEMAELANATGLVPDIRGMHGVTTTKDALIEDFLKVISRHGIVDYAMGIKGINQEAGVFVIGKRENEFISKDLEYLKKGKGPYYLFFRDHHLCYLEAPKSIADAVLFNIPTISPQAFIADVPAVVKKDLKAGEKLDGIGGFTVYGLIDCAKKSQAENLIPVGLTEYAVLNCSVEKDTPLNYSMVEFPEDNILLQLRREQDALIQNGLDSLLVGKIRNSK